MVLIKYATCHLNITFVVVKRIILFSETNKNQRTMANIRSLKKTINAISEELIGECFVCLYYMPNADSDKIVTLMNQISDIQTESLKRVGKCGGKDPKQVKAYYRSLSADFSTKMSGIIEQLTSLDAV